jgi:hypothetical protein
VIGLRQSSLAGIVTFARRIANSGIFRWIWRSSTWLTRIAKSGVYRWIWRSSGSSDAARVAIRVRDYPAIIDLAHPDCQVRGISLDLAIQREQRSSGSKDLA